MEKTIFGQGRWKGGNEAGAGSRIAFAEFAELCQRRRSVRRFDKQDGVSDADLEAILSVVERAPSAGNLRAFRIITVRDPDFRQRLAAAAYNQAWLAEAPVVLVFAALPQESGRRYGSRGRDLYAVQDASIACTYAMLAATALGYGTTWVGAFDEAGVRRVLNLAAEERPVAMLPVGWAAE